MSDTSECVKVIVRSRPINEREMKLNCKTILTMESSVGQCSLTNVHDYKAPPKTFTFDGSYDVNATTDTIYSEIAYPLVEGVTEGYNGTIFAYGQTGCGKSFTMQGITSPTSQRGIIPRAFDHIFETVSVTGGRKFLLHAAYCEIYNEEIRDLLGKDVKAKLDLKEHPEKGVFVGGLSMHPVHNVGECELIMEKGWKNRATGATLMNADSSRSHSIFTINLEMVTLDEDGEEHIRAGKLNLVDLAGSERQSKTGATGDRLKEATKINLSLSALGNVISALVDGKSKHIPYRDSKLTRLLQDSLGGNTKTLMVACLSPADNNYEETLSTLRYANRAKNIQNKPKINEDPKDALLRQYQEEISKLKAMLMGQLPIPEGGFSGVDLANIPAHRSDPQQSRETLELEKQQIKEEFDEELSKMKAQYEEEKINKTKLQADMVKLRAFYDQKLSSVEGQMANLPSTAAILGEIEWNDEGMTAQEQEQEPDAVVAAPVVIGGTVATVAKAGEVIQTQTIQKEVIKTEVAAPLEKPESITSSAQLPEGPEIPQAELQHEQDNFAATYKEIQQPVVSKRSDQQLDEGLKAPRSSPTQNSMREQLIHQQEEALKRLQELEGQMVGGENIDNEEVKERHVKKMQFAEERKVKLADAISNMDDDGIMLQIYDNIQDELRHKNKLLEKEKTKCVGLRNELADIQSEFEFERIDYLDTIRKQEKQMKLLQELLERVQPLIRRDCNYSNLDKIKMDSRWSEEQEKWVVPKITLDRGGTLAGEKMNGMVNGHEDRYKQKLMMKEEARYFQPSRRAQMMCASEPPNRINVSQIKDSISNSPSNQSLTSIGSSEDIMKSELKAAQVHGQIINEEGSLLRKPGKLEALPSLSQSTKKSRKKKSVY